MISLHQEDRKAISLLITPSWLSGLIAILVGLVLTVGVIAAFTANNSSIQKQLVSWQQSQPEKPKDRPFYTPINDKPTLENTWPLLLVWTIIGLVVYVIAASVIHSFSNAEQIRESLGYVNARPQEIIKMTAAHVILRVLAAIMLGVLISIFLKTAIPYSITAAHASAAEVLSLEGILYAIVSFAIVVFNLHLIVIFLRMSLGRVRLFSSAI